MNLILDEMINKIPNASSQNQLNVKNVYPIKKYLSSSQTEKLGMEPGVAKKPSRDSTSGGIRTSGKLKRSKQPKYDKHKTDYKKDRKKCNSQGTEKTILKYLMKTETRVGESA